MRRRSDSLVETDWLAAHLHHSDLRVLEQGASLSESAAGPSLPMEQG